MDIKELIEQLKLPAEVKNAEELITNFSNTAVENYKKETNVQINDHANKIITDAFTKVGKNFDLELEFKEGEKQSDVLTGALTKWKEGVESNGGEWKSKYDEVIKNQPDADKIRNEIEDQVKEGLQKDFDAQLKRHTDKFEADLAERDKSLNDFKTINAFNKAMPKFDPEAIDKFGKANFDVVQEDVIRKIRDEYEVKEENGSMVAKKGFDTSQISDLLKDNDRLKPFISKEHNQQGGGAGQGSFKETFGIDPKLPLHELIPKVEELVGKTIKKNEDPVKFAQEVDKHIEKILKPKEA